MPIRKWIINTPHLSEYFYHVFKQVPTSVIKELTLLETKIFKNDRSIRRFSENETLEKRLSLLMRCNMRFGLVIAPIKVSMDDSLIQIREQFSKENKRLEVIKEMINNEVFITTSKELLEVAHMGSQNCHGSNFILSYDWLTVQEGLYNQTGGETSSKLIKGALKGADILGKVLLTSLSMKDTAIEGICGVKKTQLLILLCLYSYKNDFVAVNRIKDETLLKHNVQGIARMLFEMEKKDLVTRLVTTRHRTKNTNYNTFAIIDKGVDVVLKFLKYVMNKSVR